MNLPFFPLKLVVFPDEELSLHIFEPRYIELIADVELQGSSFGICTFLDQLTGFGTEVKLIQVHQRYEDGRLDITVRGLRVFKIITFQNPQAGKSYAAGEVEFIQNDFKVLDYLHYEYLFYLREMLTLLNYQVELIPEAIDSYSFSHKIGLTLEEELELLKLSSEAARTQFLIDHFKRMIPVLKAAEHAKQKILQNGHFKHLDPLDF